MRPVCHWCGTMTGYRTIKISDQNVLLCKSHYNKYRKVKRYKLLLIEFYEKNTILQTREE